MEDKEAKAILKAVMTDDIETAQFLVRNQGMTIRKEDWPAQRRYLKFWLKQFNNALLGSKKEIGKAIMLDIIGTKTEKILNTDKVEEGESLKIAVKALTAKEFNDYIFSRLKSK